MRDIPDELASGPFTVRDATEQGVPRHVLRGKRFRHPSHGVLTLASAPDTLRDRCRAAALILPQSAVFSHGTAVALGGWLTPRVSDGRSRYEAIEPDALAPLHVTVPHDAVRPQARGITGHRSDTLPGDLIESSGLRITSPRRTWCDLGTDTQVEEAGLVILADALRRRFASGEDRLRQRLDLWSGRRGARILRRALERSRDRVDSPMETRLRLIFEDGGLPEPMVNEWVRRDDGDPLHCPDLSWPTWRLAADYDGAHHADRDTEGAVRTGRASNWRERQDNSRHDLLDEVDWLLRIFTSFDVFRAPERAIA